MLDAGTPLAVPGAEVLAWADLDLPGVVWALPARPRLVIGADGLPDASLLLYRRGRDNPPDGGQLALTVDLALTGQERAAAAAAGEARRPPTEPPAPPPPPVEVRAPQWIEAAVHAELLPGVHGVPGLSAGGRPSLMADNACALALQLDGEQAAAVQRAWEDGFPEATIELDGAIDGAVQGSASASTAASATSCAEGIQTTRAAGFTVAAAARTAVRVPLRLRGPLRLPPQARTARRTDLTL